MKPAPIPGNQSSFEILQLLDMKVALRYESLMILFFSSVVVLIQDESNGACLV